MMRLICTVVVAITLGHLGDAVSPYQYPPYGEQVATGVLDAGGQYGQQTAASETHDKKNFGLNFSSDKGTSNKVSNINAQVAGAGAYTQGYPSAYSSPAQYPVSGPSVQYAPRYPEYQYPQYSVPQTNYQYPSYSSGYPYSQQYPTVPAPQVPQTHSAGGLGWRY